MFRDGLRRDPLEIAPYCLPIDYLARVGRREAEDVLGAVVTQRQHVAAMRPAADVDAGGL
jgi:hypothetical protein